MSALPVAAGADRLPVSLLTGFLGSGKTTLLNRLLRQPAMARTAVVINELGEIALDQQFVEKTQGETLVLANGCLCCSIQGDMESVIGMLFARRAQGEGPGFDRMLIESSGLADPAPIMQMLLGQPLVVENFRLDTVIATVDALHGERQLREHEEAFKQAALADRLVVTKADLAGDEKASALERHLQSINPGATRCRSQHSIGPQQLFGAGRLDTPQGLAHWLPACDTKDTGAGTHEAHRHSEGVASVSLTADQPLRWTALNRWLTELRIRHADRLLRVKGIVRLEGERLPVAIHGVHHVFHPPEPLPHLAAGADGAGSRLVLVTRGLPRDEVQSSWDAFLEASGQPVLSRP